MQTMVITLGSRDYLLCLGRILFDDECAPVFRAITEIFDKIYDGNLHRNSTTEKLASANCECKLKLIYPI